MAMKVETGSALAGQCDDAWVPRPDALDGPKGKGTSEYAQCLPLPSPLPFQKWAGCALL